MKLPSDELFKLIKALAEHEHKFIKQSLAAHKSNTVNQKLYDYLSTCDEYDEEKLLVTLDFLNKPTLKYNKRHLFDYLLTKLEQFHSDVNEEQRVFEALTTAKLLRQKKIYVKAEQILKTAIEKSKMYGFYLLQMQLQDELQLLALENKDIKKYELLKKKHTSEVPILLDYYKLMRTHKELFDELNKLNIQSTEIKLSPPEKQQRREFIHHNIMHKIQEATDKKLPSIIQLQIEGGKYYSYLQLGDYENAKRSFLHYKHNYEKKGFNTLDPATYLMLLFNGVAICITTNDHELLNCFIKTTNVAFEALPVKKRTNDILSHYYSLKVNEIIFLILNKEFEEAKNRCELFWDEILSSKTAFRTKKIFLSNACEVYLCVGEPKKALRCYNLIVTNPQIANEREDIDDALTIAILAIYYELNMFENMKSSIRGSNRDEKQKQKCEIYKQLLVFYSRLSNNITDSKKTQALFEDMLKKLDGVDTTDKASLLFLQYTTIRFWIQKKLVN